MFPWVVTIFLGFVGLFVIKADRDLNKTLVSFERTMLEMKESLNDAVSELDGRFDRIQTAQYFAGKWLAATKAGDKAVARAFRDEFIAAAPKFAAGVKNPGITLFDGEDSNAEIDFLAYLNSKSKEREGWPVFVSGGDPQWHPTLPRVLFAGVTNSSPDSRDLFVYDFPLDALCRLTVSSGSHYRPRWSPRGERIVFEKHDGQASTWLARVTSDGLSPGAHTACIVTMESKVLGGAKAGQFHHAYFPNFVTDEWLVVTGENPTGDHHLYLVPLSEGAQPDSSAVPIAISEEGGRECKGNFIESEAGLFIVYNQFFEEARPDSVISRIYRAKVHLAPEPRIDAPELVHESTRMAEAPEFAGSENALIFVEGEKLKRMWLSGVDDGKNVWSGPELLYEGKEKLLFPDWRPDYSVEVAEYYAVAEVTPR